MSVGGALAQEAPADADATMRTQAAAAVSSGHPAPRSPDFLEHLVDSFLALFNMNESGNTIAHYAIAAVLLLIALLARRIVTQIIFVILKKVASRTRTTFDDKLFPALEAVAATFVMLVGIFSSLKVLKLTPEADFFIRSGSRVAFSLVIFWGLWRTLEVLLKHGQEIAAARGMGIASFMPWIRKTLLTIFVVMAVLLTIQSMGYDVKAILAGLGIGGLAFALAAQDTLANIFGAIVVATDQPFKIGEFVQIGPHMGLVEDIGLRSTRLRRVDKSLIVIPNKTVAAEAIVNLSRFTQRRIEQIISLTYDTKPEQMEEMVGEIRRLIHAQPEVDPGSVLVFFRDFAASSLDIWVVYMTKDGDFPKSFELRQRMNMAFMRAVAERGLSFAFPTQTIQLEGQVARQLAERGDRPASPPPPRDNSSGV